jgi:hypothetical protein
MADFLPPPRWKCPRAQLTLFVGFFLIGVTIEMCEWKPSRAMAMSSLIIFFGMTLILAICRKRGAASGEPGCRPS